MKAVEFLIRFVIEMIANGLLAALGGLWLMLAVAVAHDHWVSGLPTLGYWWAFLIVFLLQGAFKTVDLDRGKS